MKHRRLLLQGLLCALPLAAAAQPAARVTAGLAAPAVLEALNAYRSAQGLAPLTAAPGLQRLAAEHSAMMAGQGRLSHEAFDRRFEGAGAELCVENVAQGHRSAEQLIQGWRAVPTHHRNMLESRVTYAGIATQGRYVTFLACDVPGR